VRRRNAARELLNAYLLCDANLDLLRGIASVSRHAIGDRIEGLVARLARTPTIFAANVSAKSATKQTKNTSNVIVDVTP
jgi:hypothetical protein